MRKVLATLLATALCLPALGHERLVAVSGYGEIETHPDSIRITFSISKGDRRSIAKAKSEVDALSSKAAAALIDIGVREQDIFSSEMRIDQYERYDSRDNCYFAHVATREIDVIVRDVDRYSAAVQALVDVGITEIRGVDSEISDRSALNTKALKGALQDARAKAKFMADEMGVTLGSVHRIGDRQNGYDFEMIEEIVVTATSGRRSPGDSLLYEFKPRPVTVSARVHVEFVIE